MRGDGLHASALRKPHRCAVDDGVLRWVYTAAAWLLATQRKPGAVEMAQRANVLLPERAALLGTLALAHESENQLPEAIRVQQKAVGLDPKDPMLKLSLAKLLIKHGDKSAARKELESLARPGCAFAGQAEVSALLQ